jgi:hypothetical protein
MRTLTVLVATGTLVAFNANYYLVSAFSGTNSRYRAVVLAPEVPAAILLVLAALPFVVWRRDGNSAVATSAGIALVAFVAWSILVASAIHGAPRAVLTFGLAVGIFVAAYGCGRFLAYECALAFARILPILPLLALIALGAFVATDRVEFEAGWLKPQLVGGIRSSEMAIFAGLQFFYCAHSLRLAGLGIGSAKVAVLGLASAAAMLIWTLSVASIASVALLLFLTHHMGRGKQAGWWWIVVPLVAFVLMLLPTVADFIAGQLSAKLVDYTEEGIRLPTLLLLLVFIVEAPLTGIGLGQFAARSAIPGAVEGLYPHNNLLGLAAELGVIAALLYAVFIATVIGAARHHLRAGEAVADLRVQVSASLGTLALLCFVYLQLKGLVQDTWQLKESFWWAGLACGIRAVK